MPSPEIGGRFIDCLIEQHQPNEWEIIENVHTWLVDFVHVVAWETVTAAELMLFDTRLLHAVSSIARNIVSS